MRYQLTIALLATALLAINFADAAVRVRISSYRSIRIGSSYRSYRYTYYSGPVYTRRISTPVMGPVYYAYASRYPLFFSYRRTPVGSTDETCKNYLALSNGSYIGAFSCPFLPDEPGNWTSCCGYENEEFCCDPSYDDSWKYTRLSALAISLIVVFTLIALAVAIILIVCCCCIRKRHQPAAAGGASGEQLAAKPFVDTQGKQIDGSISMPPPYPTMEYGTIPVQPQVGAGASTPYPPPPPPYPAYGGRN